MGNVNPDEIEEVNGWQVYRSTVNDKMGAYRLDKYRPEQKVFNTDGEFIKWYEEEKKKE